jgi:ProP effector
MGFEQLASLKDQLAKQAKQAQLAKKADAKPTVVKKKAEPVDPVVLTIGLLQKRFPKVFPKSPAPKIPLKLGIHKDLFAQAQQLGLTETALREAIKTWCRGTRYWACIVEDAVRVDLAGEEAGRVLPTEAARARTLEANRHRKKPSQKVQAAQEVKVTE